MINGLFSSSIGNHQNISFFQFFQLSTQKSTSCRVSFFDFNKKISNEKQKERKQIFCVCKIFLFSGTEKCACNVQTSIKAINYKSKKSILLTNLPFQIYEKNLYVWHGMVWYGMVDMYMYTSCYLFHSKRNCFFLFSYFFFFPLQRV